jgi:hypothetical protein
MRLEAPFKNVNLQMLTDGDYYPQVIRTLQQCKNRCFCSIFIVDQNLEGDERLRVDSLLVELACAHWRGVDTRLIIGGSRTNERIRNTALLAFARAQELGVNVRLAAASKDHNSHVKLVVADDMVVTGSHNWSSSLFGGQIQDSVLLKSPALAAYLMTYCERQWQKTTTDKYDVSI